MWETGADQSCCLLKASLLGSGPLSVLSSGGGRHKGEAGRIWVSPWSCHCSLGLLAWWGSSCLYASGVDRPLCVQVSGLSPACGSLSISPTTPAPPPRVPEELYMTHVFEQPLA